MRAALPNLDCVRQCISALSTALGPAKQPRDQHWYSPAIILIVGTVLRDQITFFELYSD